MTIVSTDRIVVDWALRNGYPCLYRSLESITETVLMVVLDHATAYFLRGQLIKITCRKDGRFVADMADELAAVFAVCAYIDLREEAADDLMTARGARHGVVSAGLGVRDDRL